MPISSPLHLQVKKGRAAFAAVGDRVWELEEARVSYSPILSGGDVGDVKTSLWSAPCSGASCACRVTAVGATILKDGAKLCDSCVVRPLSQLCTCRLLQLGRLLALQTPTTHVFCARCRCSR